MEEKTAQQKWDAVRTFVTVKINESGEVQYAEWDSPNGKWSASWYHKMSDYRATLELKVDDKRALIHDNALLVGLEYGDVSRHYSDAYISSLYCLLGLDITTHLLPDENGLLPCPHCGAKAEREQSFLDNKYYIRCSRRSTPLSNIPMDCPRTAGGSYSKTVWNRRV